MKIKNIYKYLFAALLALQLSGCDNNTDADPKFDKTPTDRINAQVAELKEALLSSPEGWKAIYFTDNTVLGGYTHFFKFAADGTVEMASDFDEELETNVKNKSEYQIQLGSTVSLTFTTRNWIHILSESDYYPIEALRAKGYLGDFQFLYYGQENGQIIFKANRNGQEIRFVKATKEDWDNLPKNFDMIPNVVGSNDRPLFRLLETNDGKTKHQFDFSFSDVTRYATANSIETGYAVSFNFGVGYTPTGIVVNPAIEVGGQKLTDFVYNDADGSFTATGTNGVSSVIKYSSKPLALTDDYKNFLDAKPQIVLGYIAANLYTAPTTSSYAKMLLDNANATLPANQKIARVQVYFNSPYGNYIEYRFSGGRPSVYHNFTTSADDTNKRIIFNHDSWDNGSAYIPAPAFLKALDDEFFKAEGLYIKKEAFTITYTNTVYTITSATSNFRITTYQL